jgi:hypothetical protein
MREMARSTHRFKVSLAVVIFAPETRRKFAGDVYLRWRKVVKMGRESERDRRTAKRARRCEISPRVCYRSRPGRRRTETTGIGEDGRPTTRGNSDLVLDTERLGTIPYT